MRVGVTPSHVGNLPMIRAGWADKIRALSRTITVVWTKDRSAVAVAPRPRIDIISDRVDGVIMGVTMARCVRLVFGEFARELEAFGETLLR